MLSNQGPYRLLAAAQKVNSSSSGIVLAVSRLLGTLTPFVRPRRGSHRRRDSQATRNYLGRDPHNKLSLIIKTTSKVIK